MEKNDYMSYQSMLSGIGSSADSLAEICNALQLDGRAEDIRRVSERLREHTFRIAIMGEFKRGKSTVINALLGQEVVPSDVLPCTATLNRIRWDSTPRAEIHYRAGSGRTTESVAVEDLIDYVTKLSTEAENTSAVVEDATVFYPCPFCQNGVEIIDTPGLNDDERMDAISQAVLPTVDAIVMVISADVPFSISEASFLRNHVMTNDLGRIIFIVNRIDTIRKKDRARLVDSIRAKISSTIVDRIRSVYGAESEEAKNMLAKLGGIRLYPISALKALEAKLDADEEELENSGMPAFERALTRMLTEERGMLQLSTPVNTIIGHASEAMQSIDTRVQSLEMDIDEFRRKQNEAIHVIDRQRMQKKAEMEKLLHQADSLFQSMLPDAREVYTQATAELEAQIDELEIDPARLRKDGEKYCAEIAERISIAYQRAISDALERLQMKLFDHLGETIDSIDRYTKELTESIRDIRDSFTPGIRKENSGFREIAIDMAVNYAGVYGLGTVIPGVGGLISGYREAGLKGALVGGGLGGIAAFASMVFLPLTGIPLALISGAISMLVGKNVVRQLFGRKDDQTAAIRAQLRAAVQKSIDEMSKRREVENWLKDASHEVIRSISDKLNEETETVLVGMQKQIDEMEHVLRNRERDGDAERARLADLKAKTLRIIESIMPIRERVHSAIAGEAKED